MIVYTILNNGIVGIRNQSEPYTLLENERGATEWYQKPFYDVQLDEVVESITPQEIADYDELQIENAVLQGLQKELSDGQEAAQRLRTYLKRNLTPQQQANANPILKLVFISLRCGFWQEAYDEMNAINVPPAFEDVKQRILNRIAQYLIE